LTTVTAAASCIGRRSIRTIFSFAASINVPQGSAPQAALLLFKNPPSGRSPLLSKLAMKVAPDQRGRDVDLSDVAHCKKVDT
jgi:hypothetical protein